MANLTALLSGPEVFNLGQGNSTNSYGRWFSPIGPAPEGWRVIQGCSRTIPHTGESEQWQNDEMNADHYR